MKDFHSPARAGTPARQRAVQGTTRFLLLASALTFAPLASAYAQAPNTAANSQPSATTAIQTADTVQEAFVRVAQQVKPSVVSIISLRDPRAAGSTDDKPQLGPMPKSEPNKPGAKPDPKAKPTPKPEPGRPAPDSEDEGEETPFGMPFPFGPRDPNERPQSMGTGMVIRDDGYILTNYHVVRGASTIRVVFDPDTERPDRPLADLVSFDEESDLAVLKLRQPRAGLKPVEFADSDKIRIGEWAIAVGAPFEQAQSVTVGIISAKGRHLDDRSGASSLQDYIQTDASINPGNSGGPLVNLDGKVIGINTAILSPSRFNIGIGFSVPSNTVSRFLPTLLQGKPIERGFLGVSYMRLNDAVAKEFGISGGMHVGDLYKEDGKFIGPAKDAGLQVDDIITALNGQAIDSSEEFRRIVSNNAPGSKLTLSIARPNGNTIEKKDLVLTLGSRPAKSAPMPKPAPVVPTATADDPLRLGMKLNDVDKLSADERDLYGFTTGTRGLVITDVLPGSPADEAELRRALRIVRLRINGGAWQPVSNRAAYRALEKTFKPGDRVLMQLRDSRDVSVYNLLVIPGTTASAI
jgi:serine protease Do